MLVRIGRLAGVVALGLGLAGPVSAQRELTVEAIFASPELRVAGSGARWMPDGESFSYVAREGLVLEEAVTGARRVTVESSALVLPDASGPIAIEDYEWSPDGGKLLIYTNSQRVWRANTKGTYYVYDLSARTLTPLSRQPGWQQFAKWSPTGDRIGFVRDNDIFVVDVAGSEERALTTDGSGLIINGTFDWVYEEELGLQDGWRWSPDGSRIAYWQLDQTDVAVFTWIDDLAGIYSVPFELRYPKAGEPPALARIGVVSAAGGATKWLDVGGEPDDYLARMDWADSPDEVLVQRLNRLQNRIDLILADAGTGAARVVYSDTDEAWVDVDDDFTWVADGERFLWTSEADGHNQIYVVDRSGGVVRRLTDEPADVLSVVAVDEAGGWVYYTAAAPSAMERHLFRVRLAGGAAERVTAEPGSHSPSVDPTGRYVIDRYSRAGVPPVAALIETDGDPVRVLEDNAELRRRLGEFGLNAPEFFTVSGADPAAGELNGWLIRPPGFDPSREYPVLMYVYGTPGAQTVTDAWWGNRYLWHQLLAQRGYIIASVDARGSSGRGRTFEKAGYLRQGAVVTDDQIAAARWLAAQPFVDEDRIGMWGWSGGGYTTGLALARGGDLFRAGLSVAPVTDWRFYDNIYTERFMRTPQENAAGYDETSVVRLAEGLTADYLLIHGTADDNVHFQNAVQLIDALQAAGKQFDFMLYPNQNHGIPARQLHLFTFMTDWVLGHL
jgi:dipeptidyl-peptidase-4